VRGGNVKIGKTIAILLVEPLKSPIPIKQPSSAPTTERQPSKPAA
jgi:hypothetical protein